MEIKLEKAKEIIKKKIEYDTAEASKKKYGTRIYQNTMNYIYGLQGALKILEEIEDHL